MWSCLSLTMQLPTQSTVMLFGLAASTACQCQYVNLYSQWLLQLQLVYMCIVILTPCEVVMPWALSAFLPLTLRSHALFQPNPTVHRFHRSYKYTVDTWYNTVISHGIFNWSHVRNYLIEYRLDLTLQVLADLVFWSWGITQIDIDLLQPFLPSPLPRSLPFPCTLRLPFPPRGTDRYLNPEAAGFRGVLPPEKL
jgi:hypothetical protein